MGDVTKNISKEELKCNCGKCEVEIQEHEPVISVVQEACDHFSEVYGVTKVVLNITSAARCYTYNREIGSTDGSQHPRCQAMDIQLFINGKQIGPDDVFDYFDKKYPDKYGVGRYNTFTHIDTREIKARWDYVK